MPSHTSPLRRSEPQALIRLGSSIAAGAIVLDQATKFWIVEGVMSPPRVIDVTPFFNIVMVWNKGASFGLFSTQSPWTQLALGGMAIIISIALGVWLLKSQSRWLSAALGMVIGGALGNVIDRAVYGAVADFLDFHAYGYHWPSFNVADMAISVGVVMLLFDGLIAKRRDHRLTG